MSSTARRRPLGLRVRRIPRTGARHDVVIEWPWVAGRVISAALLLLLIPLVLGRHPPELPARTWIAMAPLLAIAAYVVAAFCLNRTRLTLIGHLITLEHGPLPWPGRRCADIQGTTQLFVRQQRHPRRQRPDYELCARAGSSSTPTLIVRSSHDLVAFLEQELEAVLGITDQPVAGEYGRPPPPEARVVRR
jgi:hypothetical protein